MAALFTAALKNFASDTFERYFISHVYLLFHSVCSSKSEFADFQVIHSKSRVKPCHICHEKPRKSSAAHLLNVARPYLPVPVQIISQLRLIYVLF